MTHTATGVVITRVLEKGVFRELALCLGQPLPDGTSAVFYNGCLYALGQPGAQIDVSGKRYFPDERMPLFASPALRCFERFYVDCSGRDAHVLIDGDKAIADYAETFLEKAGVQIIASGAANHLADDRRAYDWLILIPNDATARLMKAACAGHWGTAPGGLGLTSANIAFDSEAELSRNAHPPTTYDVAQRLEELFAFLQNPALYGLRSRTSLSRPSHNENAIDSLPRTEIAPFEQDLFSEWEKADARCKLLEAQRTALAAEKETLASANAKLVSLHERRPTNAQLLRSVFPEVHFVRDSESTVNRDIPDISGLAARIRAVVNKDVLSKGSKVQGCAADWFELHFATGERSNGRLYYRWRDNRTVDLLVSFKVKQPTDTKWLRHST